MSIKIIRARCGDRYFNFDVPSDVRQVICGTSEKGVEQFWKILVEDGVVTEVLSVEKNEIWNTVTANNETSRGSTPFSVAIDEIGMFHGDDVKET